MSTTMLAPGTCCGCGCSVVIGVQACGGSGLSGASVITIGGSGSYTISVTYGGNTATVAGFTLGCGSTYGFQFSTVTVQGCNNSAIVGATFTYTGTNFTGGATVTTVSVGAGAYGYFLIPNSGTYSYFASNARFTTAMGTSSSCVLTVALSAASGYVCISGCTLPIPTTLHLTDSVLGACTLTYSSGNWTGTLNYTYAAECGCPGGAATIVYCLANTGGCAYFATLYTDYPAITQCPGTSSNSGGYGVSASGVTVTCYPYNWSGSQSFGSCPPNPFRNPANVAYFSGGFSVTWTITE